MVKREMQRAWRPHLLGDKSQEVEGHCGDTGRFDSRGDQTDRLIAGGSDRHQKSEVDLGRDEARCRFWGALTYEVLRRRD